MLKHILTGLMSICALALMAQNQKTINQSMVQINELPSIGFQPQIEVSSADYYIIDEESMLEQLAGITNRRDLSKGFEAIIQLPHPDGTFHSYKAVENTTMSKEYANKFPSIISLDAVGIEHPEEVVKWDITPHGLHAMIMIPGESTIYIDPAFKESNEYYMVYQRSDVTGTKPFDCSFNSDIPQLETNSKPITGTVKSFGTCELRTYRLALAATGEYTIYHGGTVADAAAAQVTTMNRVNGVYERDMAITMEIIPNNDLIIYTTTNGDPYSNGNPGAMIGENQTTCDGIIGSANYDIGHVFGTNSGGLAGLGVVCAANQKARGVTGSGNPIGDLFDIDYVAHEMGHQFGANHTFNNSCNNNRNNATAVEPGSGNTIMAYAGICAPNTSNFSDDHFSSRSLEEIHFEILSAGHTCESLSSLSNNAPLITATNANVAIPANTPFALTATATDPDGNTLTYNWEQMDNEISTQPPVSTATGGPNFRSNPSLTSPTRYFPNLTDLANGGPFTWEVLPSVTRTMDFRVVVRDNASGGGCNDHADVTITTDANSGPFIVTYPSATGITWNALTSETVTWDVANTDQAPVSCSAVDILLSIDGGQTFPFTLATGTPNDGSEAITVPNQGTTTARVMVIATGGTFFDISDNNFTILQAVNDYTLDVSPTSISVCQPDDATYLVEIGSLDGYSDPVDLSISGVPAGATATFGSTTVTPGNNTSLVISNTDLAAAGSYTLTIEANSTTGPKTQDVTLIIGSNNPTPVTLTSPSNGATGVASPTQFDWVASSDPTASYSIEIATDAGFTGIVDQASGLSTPTYTSSSLSPNGTYYWRVMYTTSCGTSAYSSVFNFTINGCTTYSNTTPVNIPNSGTITSVINVPTSGTINDVNLLNMTGTHAFIKNLTVTLTSPLGTTVTLFDQICNNHDNFDVGFDDAGSGAGLPCPPVDGQLYQPVGLLSSFNGEDALGNWTLTIIDNANPNGGQLQSWDLEICVDPSVACTDPDIATVTSATAVCNGSSIQLDVLGGNLNDATTWTWYEGSCGGTSIGTGTSITVSPAGTTSYFVRGEGGCVTPGACAEVVVTVNPTYNTTEDVAICQGATYSYPDGSTGSTSESHTSNLTTVDGCDSIIVTNLTVNPIFSSTENIAICQGQSYTYPDGAIGTTSETYVSNLTSVDGCDSTITTNLTVNPTYSSNESVVICQGNIYTYPDGSTGTSTETHTSVLTTVDGCDSLIITDLTVYPSYSTTENVTICNGTTYTYPDGSTGSTSESHTSNLTTVDGCDSIIVTNLTVNPIFSSTENVAICQGQSYMYPDGTTGSITETHVSNLTSVDGCDSTITTNLTVNPTYSSNESVAICQGNIYTYPDGSTGTTTETHTSVLTTVDGCDSLIITDLTVYSSYSTTENVTICNGATYTYPDGSTGSTTESHTSNLTTVDGCDSIIVTNLTVNPIFSSTENVSICTGDSYTYPDGTTGSTSETHVSNLTSVDGCDSTITTNLTVVSSFNTTQIVAICDGETYTFPDGSTSTTSTTNVSTLTSQAGCDSVITTNLHVNPVYQSSEDITICQGEIYTYPDGTTGSASEVHTSLLQTISGCDSVITTNLTVAPIYSMTEEVIACENSTVTYPDGTMATITASTSYTSNLTTSIGCDSIIVTNVTMVPNYQSTEDVTICEGDTYTYPDGSTGTTTDVHTSLLTSIDGCDSTIITNLTVTSITATVSFNAGIYTADQSGASYQWIDCDNGNSPIAGETNQTFDPSVVTGNFAVIVTIGNCSETSACFLHDESGIEELNSDLVTVFPNPAKDNVQISWVTTFDKLEITDAKGSVVRAYNVTYQQSKEVSIESYAHGVYFIRLTGTNGTVVHKLIKD